ncbi:helix-turn-helix domain-containing protein [Methylobacterium sp. M6A4_1b]
MPYTEPTLSWLENLNRRERVAPPAYAKDAPTGAIGLRPPTVDVVAGLEDELQKRLGEVVFSTLCEKLGRPNVVLTEGDADIEADGLTADHLRAARALLNWSMSDLASKSGLSISTIKRVEVEPQDVTRRSYRLVVETFRMGGIRFLTLDDGTIAVAKVIPAAPGVAELPQLQGSTSPRRAG